MTTTENATRTYTPAEDDAAAAAYLAELDAAEQAAVDALCREFGLNFLIADRGYVQPETGRMARYWGLA